MHLASFMASVLLAVTPQATLNVIGPSSVPAGSVVVLDGSKSVSDFPLAWEVVPPDGASLFTFDQRGMVGVGGVFSASHPGSYDIVVIAPGWANDQHTSVAFAVAARTIVVGSPTPVPPPTPPTPPQPTDPLSQAAHGFHDDLDAAYSKNYAAAAAAIHARNALKDTQAVLKSAMSASANAAYTTRFAPWLLQFPPAGTEPTTEAQWQVVEQVMAATAGAFK
jgi:hypothetical protein